MIRGRIRLLQLLPPSTQISTNESQSGTKDGIYKYTPMLESYPSSPLDDPDVRCHLPPDLLCLSSQAITHPPPPFLPPSFRRLRKLPNDLLDPLAPSSSRPPSVVVAGGFVLEGLVLASATLAASSIASRTPRFILAEHSEEAGRKCVRRCDTRRCDAHGSGCSRTHRDTAQLVSVSPPPTLPHTESDH